MTFFVPLVVKKIFSDATVAWARFAWLSLTM
jgi:hypothetical protein